MKKAGILVSLLFICFLATGTAFGQQDCDFQIAGTWKRATPDDTNSPLYRFAPDGTVKVFASDATGKNSGAHEVASATYELDNPTAPKSISFKAINKGGVFADGAGTMTIVNYDDTSFTCTKPGSGPTRWIRVDPNRYFLVLAARSGTFYDRSGPAFSMLLKTGELQPRIDAVGTYAVQGTRAFGPVPVETYNEFMTEPRTDSEVMFRLEITLAQYQRGLKILQTWERRVREDATLYPRTSYLNNILLVKELVESLNHCSEKIKMYKLSYLQDEDWITEKYGSPFVPFNFFKELRRLNESLHVRDEEFAKSQSPKS